MKAPRLTGASRRHSTLPGQRQFLSGKVAWNGQACVPATLVDEGIPAGRRGLDVVEIRDVFGRIVLRFTAPVVNGRVRQELDVSGLPAGVYFYELVSGSGVLLGSGKLVLRPR